MQLDIDDYGTRNMLDSGWKIHGKREICLTEAKKWLIVFGREEWSR